MATKQYEATITAAFPLKDGRMMSVVEGNVYDLDFTELAKHHQELFTLTEKPAGPVKKPARRKPAPQGMNDV